MKSRLIKIKSRLVIVAIWLLFFFVLRSNALSRSVLAVGLVWMVLVLPQVRWNHSKSFYIDAHRISRGMTTQEVREIMAPHQELGVYEPLPGEADWLPSVDSYWEDTLVFFHCPLGWTDHCEVIFRRDRVARVNIVKD